MERRSNSRASGSIDEAAFKPVVSLTCFRDVRFAFNKRPLSGHSEIDAMGAGLFRAHYSAAVLCAARA